MGILYREAGVWGAGKGSLLTPAEVDGNFYDLDTRLTDVETNPPVAVHVENITATRDTLTVVMSNGTSFGPFKLPVATFRDRGEYAMGQQYYANDVIHVPQRGLYLVQFDYLTGATEAFADDATDGSAHTVYLLLVKEDTYLYDIGLTFMGRVGLGITPGDPMAMHRPARTIYVPKDFAGSIAVLSVAPTADINIPVYHKVTQIGTIHFSAGAVAGTFANTAAVVQVLATEDITLIAPALDDTAKNLCVTIVCTRSAS